MPRVSADRDLPRLERWFQEQVVGGRTSPAEGRILPSRHLAPDERVGLYAGMYDSRMRECLREDYPALVRLAGEEGFERIARLYLRAHPSRHWSLNGLGRKLPELLAGAVRVPRRALLRDVARLERAMSEVFDAQASPRLSPAELARVPAEAWERGKLRLAEPLHLLALDHRANAIVTAAREGRALPSLARKRTFVAVYRKEWTVWRMDLGRPAFEILVGLQRGWTLRRALAAGAKAFAGPREELDALVRRSFAEWGAEGFVREVA